MSTEYGRLVRQEIDLAKKLLAEGVAPPEVVKVLRERAAAYRATHPRPQSTSRDG